jgi:hypothetical protein
VILAFACRSAEHETPMPIGRLAPWRGRPDHAHVVAEVLAAELRADLEALGHAPDLVLELGVADRVARADRRASAGRRGRGTTRASPSSW